MKAANNQIEATGIKPLQFLQRLVAPAPHFQRYAINEQLTRTEK